MIAKHVFKRGLLKWSLIGLGWTLFGLFFASQVVSTRAFFGRPLQLSSALASWLTCGYLWLAVTPLILKLVRRFPLERRIWPRNAVIHLLFSFGFSAVLLASYVVATSLIGLEARSPFRTALRLQFIGSFHAEILTYWGVVGVAHALEYYRRYREREVRASQLETQLARAQLDALRMQLQPHFLFNTLNTISVLMKEDVNLANRVLVSLSELLRSTLRNPETNEVSLKEELEFLKRYLEIEQTRFHDRLNVEIKVDPTAYHAQVPHLILQPLVENVVRHAVAPRASKSTLQITAVRSNGTLELKVVDDGPGAEPTSAAGSKGIGLRNTKARLDRLYGEAHRFDFSSAKGQGVQVSITIPFHTFARDGVSSHGQNPHADR